MSTCGNGYWQLAYRLRSTMGIAALTRIPESTKDKILAGRLLYRNGGGEERFFIGPPSPASPCHFRKKTAMKTSTIFVQKTSFQLPSKQKSLKSLIVCVVGFV
ncbi:hypothetical protein CEXT_71331 [Caerostris extrusa]|uniref:Uncharacterized protein n=1 Tax=Caerostris extrusa TaxID=172846 RepID=A0AAV4U535_CAEEX|nr:hypothetical protein CEXT_71331 [Caerostris extrusa]